MSSSYIYRIYTTEDNYITLPSKIGYVRLRLRGHPLTKQNSADVYIVLKYKIDLEDHVINFNEIPESFQQDLLDEFLHIQGDEQENGDVLRFNLYEAYLPEHIIKETFDTLVNEDEDDEEEKVSSHYSVRWDNFALSFYNGEEYDGNITNAIKEIVVIRNQSGNRLGGRKRRRRKKSKRKKSKRKKSKRKKSTRRKSKKKRRKKKRK